MGAQVGAACGEDVEHDERGGHLGGGVACGGEAALQRHEVQSSSPAHDEFAVEHDVAGELVGDGGDDLREVPGEGSVLAGMQPHAPPVRGGDRPEPVELGLERPRACCGQVRRAYEVLACAATAYRLLLRSGPITA
ncbi:hypothetical protein GCM10010464_27070 [Pseudonocardia yunnanensis]